MRFFQSAVTWLNSERTNSPALKVKHFVGSSLRKIWPEWRGVGSTLFQMRTWAGSPIARCTTRGCIFFVDARDEALGRLLLASREYEPQETELVEKTLHSGMTFVDVGANVGYFTVLAAKKVGPTGRVFSFEPEPHNFELLKRNVGANQLTNVAAHNAAVVDKPKEINMYLSAYNYGDHRIVDSDDDSIRNTGRRHKTVSVGGVRLDDCLAAYEKPIDIIKIDVQGAEYLVLKGMKQTLIANPGVLLLTEFWPWGMRLNGTDPDSYLDELRDLGFNAYQFDSDGSLVEASANVRDLAGPQEYTNLLFARSERALPSLRQSYQTSSKALS